MEKRNCRRGEEYEKKNSLEFSFLLNGRKDPGNYDLGIMLGATSRNIKRYRNSVRNQISRPLISNMSETQEYDRYGMRRIRGEFLKGFSFQRSLKYEYITSMLFPSR